MFHSKFFAMLTGLLLAFSIAAPGRAQTVKDADDGTTLQQIIIFGRHSIRAPINDPSTLAPFAVDPYPSFTGVPNGYLTPNGQRAAGLLGAYFHDYLLHEGLLTGNAETDLSHSYFRSNSIQRSFVTATKFGEGLDPRRFNTGSLLQNRRPQYRHIRRDRSRVRSRCGESGDN